MRHLIIACLIAVFTFFTPSRTQPILQQSQANPAILLAPEAAILMLEAVILACAAAAAIGIISNATNQSYQRELEEKVASIKAAMKRGIEATKEAVVKSVATLIRVRAALGMPSLGCDILMRTGSRTTGSSNKTNEARRASEGECDPELRGSPFDCCPKFMKKFGAQNSMTPVGRNAFKVKYWGRHANSSECCFEWDSLHGRFEVYRTSNHEGVKHAGEKTCASDENLDDDLCTATHPEKADFLSRRHQPRNGCQ